MSLRALPFTLSEGKEITVRGYTDPDGGRFSINLCSGTDYARDNTALHFNPRFDQNEVVRNHYENGWGDEERSGDFPFSQGQQYEVRIVVTDGEYQIYVNGSHFCNFGHRLPVESSRNIYVDGDTNAVSVDFRDTHQYRVGVHRIPFALTDGKEIRINGFADPNVDRFSINLCSGFDLDSGTALHFNPRFDQNEVVRNHFDDGWGDEETGGDFPFSKGEPFDVKIVVSESEYKIYVNGNHFCDFGHRMPRENVQNVYVGEETLVRSVTFSDAVHRLPFALDDGKEIMVRGRTNPDSNRFSINLCSGADTESDIALHFNPRFDQNEVVRNHKQGDDWGDEEREGGFPFVQGESFEVRIVTKDPYYQVFVNGSHFCEFNHRFEKETVQNVYVEGDATIDEVSFKDRSPMHSPTVPLNCPIPGALRPRRRIILSGKPSSAPERFSVNLMTGRNFDNDDLALHFDARFNFGGTENVTVRTHRQGGDYGDEEREEAYFPFAPDAPFDMIIDVTPAHFSIIINNQHHSNFDHRIRPLPAVDHLNIHGDVELFYVRFE